MFLCHTCLKQLEKRATIISSSQLNDPRLCDECRLERKGLFIHSYIHKDKQMPGLDEHNDHPHKPGQQTTPKPNIKESLIGDLYSYSMDGEPIGIITPNDIEDILKHLHPNDIITKNIHDGTYSIQRGSHKFNISIERTRSSF